ncbi:MAG: hypothetical protein M1338_04190 [Patescibacteria group bacterium]|nr:hypothetical protein [Patescibacteria group bacterium]
MKSFDRISITPQQRTVNRAAEDLLVVNSYYCFDPPITATGRSVRGADFCPSTLCTFKTAQYLGKREGLYIFQGIPIDDKRQINIPPGYEDIDQEEINKRFRRCFFRVEFTGGSKITLIDNLDK